MCLGDMPFDGEEEMIAIMCWSCRVSSVPIVVGRGEVVGNNWVREDGARDQSREYMVCRSKAPAILQLHNKS